MAPPNGPFGGCRGGLRLQPRAQLREDGRAVLLAQLAVGRRAHHVRLTRLGLHPVEGEDEVQSLSRLGRGGERVEEAAPAVRPAADAHAPVRQRHRVVAGIPIHHERARGAT